MRLSHSRHQKSQKNHTSGSLGTPWVGDGQRDSRGGGRLTADLPRGVGTGDLELEGTVVGSTTLCGEEQDPLCVVFQGRWVQKREDPDHWIAWILLQHKTWWSFSFHHLPTLKVYNLAGCWAHP